MMIIEMNAMGWHTYIRLWLILVDDKFINDEKLTLDADLKILTAYEPELPRPTPELKLAPTPTPLAAILEFKEDIHPFSSESCCSNTLEAAAWCHRVSPDMDNIDSSLEGLSPASSLRQQRTAISYNVKPALTPRWSKVEIFYWLRGKGRRKFSKCPGKHKIKIFEIELTQLRELLHAASRVGPRECHRSWSIHWVDSTKVQAWIFAVSIIGVIVIFVVIIKLPIGLPILLLVLMLILLWSVLVVADIVTIVQCRY